MKSIFLHNFAFLPRLFSLSEPFALVELYEVHAENGSSRLQAATVYGSYTSASPAFAVPGGILGLPYCAALAPAGIFVAANPGLVLAPFLLIASSSATLPNVVLPPPPSIIRSQQSLGLHPLGDRLVYAFNLSDNPQDDDQTPARVAGLPGVFNYDYVGMSLPALIRQGMAYYAGPISQ